MYFLIIFVLVTNVYCQESANYLESAIQDLKNMNSLHQNRRKLDNLPISRQPHKAKIPPLALTKYDLARLYQAALKKGDSVLLDADSGSHMPAVVYEIPNSYPKHHEEEYKTDQDSTDTSGYYYYYYPLKSFMDEDNAEHQDVYPVETFHHEVTTNIPKIHQHQHHTHKHEHNIHITTTKQKVEEHKNSKALEPLFMAISGFIGMALMFVMSVLVLPKIGVLKSRGSKDTSPEMTNVLKVIFQAIEGQDCTDRFACELGKTAKAFNVNNNRFVKLIRRVAPTSFGKRLSDIDKYANKKYKCALIPCKKKAKPLVKTAKQKIKS